MSVSKDEKTGKWTVQCYYENWKGEKKHKKKRGFTTKKEALEWERDFLRKHICGSGNDVGSLRGYIFSR